MAVMMTLAFMAWHVISHNGNGKRFLGTFAVRRLYIQRTLYREYLDILCISWFLSAWRGWASGHSSCVSLTLEESGRGAGRGGGFLASGNPHVLGPYSLMAPLNIR